MRILTLAALLFALTACSSAPKDPYGDKRKRDYYSANKHSVKFLWEGVRQNQRVRRDTFRDFWNVRELRRENAANQAHSIRFLGESLWDKEVENFKIAWGQDLPDGLLNRKTGKFMENVRFGFLDRGD